MNAVIKQIKRVKVNSNQVSMISPLGRQICIHAFIHSFETIEHLLVDQHYAECQRDTSLFPQRSCMEDQHGRILLNKVLSWTKICDKNMKDFLSLRKLLGHLALIGTKKGYLPSLSSRSVVSLQRSHRPCLLIFLSTLTLA
jgi:hypothetical protein